MVLLNRSNYICRTSGTRHLIHGLARATWMKRSTQMRLCSRWVSMARKMRVQNHNNKIDGFVLISAHLKSLIKSISLCVCNQLINQKKSPDVRIDGQDDEGILCRWQNLPGRIRIQSCLAGRTDFNRHSWKGIRCGLHLEESS